MNQLATLSNDKEIQFILGPCQIESREHALFMAHSIDDICSEVCLLILLALLLAMVRVCQSVQVSHIPLL